MPTLSTPGALAVAERRLRGLLEAQDDDTQIIADLNAELTLAARILRRQIPTLADYPDLGENDAAFYDLIVGLSAAIKLLSPAIAQAHDGMAKLKTELFEYTFTVPDQAERDRWQEEIEQAISSLSTVESDSTRQASCFSMFMAAGVARQRLKRYCASDITLLLTWDSWGLTEDGFTLV